MTKAPGPSFPHLDRALAVADSDKPPLEPGHIHHVAVLEQVNAAVDREVGEHAHDEWGGQRLRKRIIVSEEVAGAVVTPEPKEQTAELIVSSVR